MFFFCGSDIGKDFPIAKDLSENPADTGIIITNLFIGKRKICFNRKAFAMFGRTSPTTGLCRCKIIHDRINPCIANQIQIRIFINDGYQILFCIPAVTKDDDMIFAVKFRHNLPDHGGCQFQFRFFFLPHTIAKRNGKIRYFIPIPDRYAEHDTHKAVSIQIVGTVVCSMVKQF